jgi:hypothetical protein
MKGSKRNPAAPEEKRYASSESGSRFITSIQGVMNAT